MGNDYEIVGYRPEFRKDVVELQRQLWSPDPELNTAYLEWKHERNPYLQPPLIYLALHGRNVVGMRSMFGVRWEYGVPAKTVSGICPDDLVIASGHRDRGLITRMMTAAFDDLEKKGYRYVYSLSAGRITRLASLAMRWRSAGSMEPHRWHSRRAEYFRRIREFAEKARFIRRYAEKVPYRRGGERQRNLHDLCTPGRTHLRNLGGPIVVERGVRAGEMADLVSRIGHDGRIRHVRDEEYLSWRYRNPLHRYLFLYWKERDLEGYLVLQQYLSVFSPSMVRVNIVDWEATSRHVRAGLLRAATRLTPFAELNIWTATLGEETRNLLREAGFTPVQGKESVDQEQPCLLVRSARADEPEAGWSLGDRRLREMADWDIRMIYSMQG